MKASAETAKLGAKAGSTIPVLGIALDVPLRTGELHAPATTANALNGGAPAQVPTCYTTYALPPGSVVAGPQGP